MPDNDAIGCERLDRCYSVRAEQSLQTIQGALAFEDQAHDGALHLIRSHRLRT